MSAEKFRVLNPATAARAALLAAPLLFGAADAKAENKPCEQDFMCAAARGLIEPVSLMAPKKSQKDLDLALSYAVLDCRADLIQVLIKAGANKHIKENGVGMIDLAEVAGCSDRTRNLLR